MGTIQEIFDRDPLTPEVRARSKTTSRIGDVQDAIMHIAREMGMEPPAGEAEELTPETLDVPTDPEAAEADDPEPPAGDGPPIQVDPNAPPEDSETGSSSSGTGPGTEGSSPGTAEEPTTSEDDLKL